MIEFHYLIFSWVADVKNYSKIYLKAFENEKELYDYPFVFNSNYITIYKWSLKAFEDLFYFDNLFDLRFKNHTLLFIW
jgi:hypothetical protein